MQSLWWFGRQILLPSASRFRKMDPGRQKAGGSWQPWAALSHGPQVRSAPQGVAGCDLAVEGSWAEQEAHSRGLEPEQLGNALRGGLGQAEEPLASGSPTTESEDLEPFPKPPPLVTRRTGPNTKVRRFPPQPSAPQGPRQPWTSRGHRRGPRTGARKVKKFGS